MNLNNQRNSVVCETNNSTYWYLIDMKNNIYIPTSEAKAALIGDCSWH